MKPTVIIYTALVLVGTATGISIQQPRVQSKGMESAGHLETKRSQKLQQIRQHLMGGEEVWGACCFNNESECQIVSYYPDDGNWCIQSGGTFYENMYCNEIECNTFGACCLSNGDCIDNVATYEDCSHLYGVNYSGGGLCNETECYSDDATCCVPDSDTCLEMNAYSCYVLGGVALWSAEPECSELCSRINSPCDEINIFSNVASILETSGCAGFLSLYSNEYLEIATPDFLINGQQYKIVKDADFDVTTWSGNQDWDEFLSGGRDNPKSAAVTNSEYGEINGIIVLNLETVDFTNVVPNDGYGEHTEVWTHFDCVGYFDVTQDGKADAIIQVRRDGNVWDGGDYQGKYLCYLENISESSGAACASDLNGNGSVDVADILTVIGDWGPCE